MNDVMVIGIAGGSGSGKTTLAREIERRLGQRVILLSHDAYYRRHDDIPFREREKLNYDHPDALETELLIEHIRQLKEGRPVDCPVYDFSAHNRSDSTVRVQPRRVIVVEGILIFHSRELRELMDLRIFVDAEADVRLCRRIQRDVSHRGRTVESVLTQYADTVRPMHLKFVEPTKKYASFILPNGGKDKAVQDMLINHITQFLNNVE